MKYLIPVLLLLPLFGQSQVAPDFTVTDSDGIQHRLYADHLNQGRTVLIKIFFTTCPPCRSIAASTEIFYQQWGGGEHDVEFIELSTMGADDDVRVNNYKEMFGITFPSVGADGGSQAALEPYLDGDFGPFFGTPTFVVIAPDGTVQWDVNGPDLWIALDTALYATGATKPGDDPVDPPDTTITPDPEPVEIAGHVRSFDGVTGISSAVVQAVSASGHILAADTTSTEGAYLLRLDSVVAADSALTILVNRNDDPKNGVSAQDLLIIQKHLLGLEPLAETQFLFASDANINDAISATDLLYFIRLLLDLEEHFPDGRSWLFFPGDLSLGPPSEQPPAIQISPVLVSEIMGGQKSPDFRGIKRGDVNDSADY